MTPEEIAKRVEGLSTHTSEASKATSRIFVGSLKPHFTKEDLFEIFYNYGEIEAISISKSGYGFVQFSNEESAKQASVDEQGNQYKGCVLQVRQCSPGDLKKKGGADGHRKFNSPPRNRRRSRSRSSSRESSRDRSNSPRGRRPRSRSPIPRRPPPMTPHARGPPMEEPRRPNDCEIVVINKLQREYGENIERRLRNLGMKVDLLFLKDEALLGQALDDLAVRGTLYAAVIAPQHESHNSLTLNVLYGMPQEHRNMPLDEALKFVAKNYREHLERQRDRNSDESEREIKFLLKLLIDSRYVSIPEYEHLIRHLTMKRDKLIMMETEDSRRAPSPHRDPLPSQLMSRHMDRPSSEQSQQQLQEKILEMIGAPNQSLAPAAAPVSMPLSAPPMLPPPQMHFPSAATASSLPQTSAASGPASNSGGGTFLNFNNPSVQEALEKLMKNGSGNIGGGMGGAMPPRDKDRNDIPPPAVPHHLQHQQQHQMPPDMQGYNQYAAGGYDYQYPPPQSKPYDQGYDSQGFPAASGPSRRY